MKAARFVVDTHSHVTTLYRPWKDRLNELGMAWDKGQHSKGFKWTHPTAEPYDNSPLCLYDMETYDVDMCILKPSFIGTTNEAQAELVLFRRPADRRLDDGGVKRFGDIVVGPDSQCLDGGLQRGVAGEDDDLHLRLSLSDTCKDLHPVSVGQHEIEESDCELLSLGEF